MSKLSKLFSALFITTAFAAVPAFAETAPAAAQAPAQESEMPQSTNTGSCQPVKFTRPDVTDQNDRFMITLHRGDLQTITACNPDEQVHRTPNGVGVVVTYQHGSATINLPSALKDDSASNGRCVNDTAGNVADAIVYKAHWSDGLPDHVDLQKLDESYYDKPTLMKVCEQLMDAHKHHN